ncbi:MAG: asparagine synthase (glutamine-hydrolyzing) [Planctomycetes bacterium]|nr:asparagine synthase (glutamine-hydrolyzing) [Planctomycetota bacterium]
MCGIAGIVDHRGNRSAQELERIAAAMADAMPYRGPDDRGTWVSPDGRCAFGHRRLSIIDTSSGGHQPFVDEAARVAITFNGEIYNYRELKQDLEAAGHRFRTKSDTEVLLALVTEHRERAFEQLDGQFAFGFWDATDRSLLLGRDPFGEKPLYFAQGDGWFAFASELHALARVPGFDPAIDRDTIAEYLALQYVDAPRSIWRNASKLRPGHWLRLDGEGRVRTGRHFAFEPRGGVRPSRPMPELADELEDILLRLVERRMIADVPLGAFLSGGVDSSTVVALMTKALGGTVKTFSIGFENSPDETEHLYARQIAQHLGTEHHDRVLELEVLPLLHHIGTVLDEPNGDSSCLPTFLVSKIAKERVTVCLSGDGGDEMFGGYGRYFATLQDEARDIPGFDAGRWYYGSRMLIHLDEHLAELFGEVPPRTKALLGSLRRRLSREPGPLLHRMRAHDAAHYMPGAVLPKVDRMSMQHSLEVRTPFLSRELAAFCEQLAVDDLYRDTTLHGPQGKLVLKELAQRYIPRAWLDRKKMGFGVPTKTGWGKDALVSWLRELVLGSDAKLAAWIDKRGREAFVRRQDASFSFYQSWLVLVLELWLRNHDATRADDATTPPLEPRAITDVASGDLRREDLLVWRCLRDAREPGMVFCADGVPPFVAELPPGSAIVTPEPVELVAGLVGVVFDWSAGTTFDPAAIQALPRGPAVFTTPLHEAHDDLLDLLRQRGQPILFRVGSRWLRRDDAAPGNDVIAAAADSATLGERLFGHRVGPGRNGPIEPSGGFAWKVALPRLARDRALERSGRVAVFEDGKRLLHGESSKRAVQGVGGGRHCLDGEWLHFSASDNSDPTTNGRRYLVALRNRRRGGPMRVLSDTKLGRLALDACDSLASRFVRPRDATDVHRFRRPFAHDGGAGWIVSLQRLRVPRAKLREGWTAVVLEDGRELPLRDAVHEDVRRLGGGRHSVWEDHVWFSATDNSNPNTNGRSYALLLVPPGAAAPSAASGRALAPVIASSDDFERRFAELARERPARPPCLEPGSRIVLAIGALHPGGTERQLCNLAVELDRLGYAVTVLALAGLEGSGGHYRNLLRGTRVAVKSGLDSHRDVVLGAAAHDDRRLDFLAGLPEDFASEVWRLYLQLAALRPEVLHCCLDVPNLLGGIAGILADVPCVAMGVRSFNPTQYPASYRPWFDRYYRILGASPRCRLFANSRACATDYATWLGGDPGFTVVPNGLDVKSLGMASDADANALRDELGVPRDAPLVVGLMRLAEEKRPLVFVNAIAAARQALPGLCAMLVGIGPLEREVKETIARSGLRGCFHLLGRRHDLAAILRASDALLLTSRIEGLPNALLEAQWFERPVVSTNAGGCREAMVDGVTGRLCPVDDADALGQALAELLADPARARAMGTAGKDFVAEHFTLESLVAATLALYRTERG